MSVIIVISVAVRPCIRKKQKIKNSANQLYWTLGLIFWPFSATSYLESMKD